MRILLLGAGGQLGRELARTLAPLGEVRTAARAGEADLLLDLSDLAALRERVEAEAPDWIVNAAAYTAVDAAEADGETARAVNGEAVAVLARHAAEHDAALLHFSTDYVFPGDGTRPYREDDPVDPVNAYGASKLVGERAIAASGCPHLLLRTAWVYGNHGRNFLRSMLGHAARQDRLTIVDDQRGSPTWSRMLAQLATLALHDVVRRGWRNRSGIYHVTARGETTWCRFAQALLERAHALGLLERMPRIEPITTAAYPTPARRPAYSVLDNRRFEQAFDLRVPGWEAQLELCLRDFQGPR